MPLEWVSLVPGNTRLHWAHFTGNTLTSTWHTSHIAQDDDADAVRALIGNGKDPCTGLRVYVADVVPSQTQRLQEKGENVSVLPLSRVMEGQYDTMGKDRVLSVLGAWQEHQCSALVIDAGMFRVIVRVSRVS